MTLCRYSGRQTASRRRGSVCSYRSRVLGPTTNSEADRLATREVTVREVQVHRPPLARLVGWEGARLVNVAATSAEVNPWDRLPTVNALVAGRNARPG